MCKAPLKRLILLTPLLVITNFVSGNGGGLTCLRDRNSAICDISLAISEIESGSDPIPHLEAAIGKKPDPDWKLVGRREGQMKPAYYLPYYYLGWAYYKAGNCEQAREEFQKSLNRGQVQWRTFQHQHLEKMKADCELQDA